MGVNNEKKLILRFENFLIAYDINTDARKKALLLHFAGPKACMTFMTLSTATIGDNYANTLIKVLNNSLTSCLVCLNS